MGGARTRSIVTVATLVLLLTAIVPAVRGIEPVFAAVPPVKIMPLGDSITVGAHDGNASNGGYRIKLEDDLVAGGISFDFVGTQSSGPSTLNDKNHEGHGGFLINDLRANIFSYLAKAPAVVLLMIGTNDIGQGVATGSPSLAQAPTRLASLLDTILANSQARIVVAQITPWKGAAWAAQDQAARNFNASIPAIVNARSSRVSLVDMYHAINTATDMADENHPNLSGYNKIADRWNGALRPLLLPKIVPGSVTVNEGNNGTTVVQVPVNLSTASSQTVTAHWSTLDDSATAPTDYPSASGTVSFTPGQTSKTVSVTVNGDTAVEPDERFFASFSNPTNATIGGVFGLGFVTITNDDSPPQPKIVPGSVTVNEDNNGTTVVQVPVNLSTASSQTVTAHWSTLDDSATAPTDYPSASGTVSFSPGQTSKTVSVTVNGDNVDEPDERFFASFSNPTNATIGGIYGLGFVTITDDDPPPQVVPGAVTVTEGNAGTVLAQLRVTLSAPSAHTVTADWSTLDDSAASPADFPQASGSVSFAPGQTSKIVAVTVNGDTTAEPEERFFAAFTNPSNATIGGIYGLGIITITDDD